MKTRFYTLILSVSFLFTLTANAQQAPYETIVNGVKVIVQPSGNGIVVIQTVIRGGVQNYIADKAGIESLALSALTECGTLKNDKNSFKNKLDKVSARVYGSTSKDFATISMNCIKSDFETVWPLYAEAITQPAFNANEFERIRQDAITRLKAQNSQPDAAIDKYAEKVAFAGRDYAKDPAGTETSLAKLTVAETKRYYESILTKSRMLIVVVADLDKANIEKKVKELLTGIKPGLSFALKKSSFRIYKNTFVSTPKEVATNYIEGITGGPQPGSKDYTAYVIAMRIFADRHFLEIRTNNGLSYAPQAWFSGGASSSTRFAVSTTEPDKYIAVFDKMVDDLKKKGFTADEVKNMKTEYLTSFYYRQETNAAQAGALVGNEVLHNNWRRSFTLVDDVKKLSLEEVNVAFKTYFGNTTWVYQGDTKKVKPILFINGTIKRIDNPVNH